MYSRPVMDRTCGASQTLTCPQAALFVWEALWSPNRACKMNILQAALLEPSHEGEETRIKKWIFTAKDGKVRKKVTARTNLSTLRQQLIATAHQRGFDSSKRESNEGQYATALLSGSAQTYKACNESTWEEVVKGDYAVAAIIGSVGIRSGAGSSKPHLCIYKLDGKGSTAMENDPLVVGAATYSTMRMTSESKGGTEAGPFGRDSSITTAVMYGFEGCRMVPSKDGVVNIAIERFTSRLVRWVEECEGVRIIELAICCEVVVAGEGSDEKAGPVVWLDHAVRIQFIPKGASTRPPPRSQSTPSAPISVEHGITEVKNVLSLLGAENGALAKDESAANYDECAGRIEREQVREGGSVSHKWSSTRTQPVSGNTRTKRRKRWRCPGDFCAFEAEPRPSSSTDIVIIAETATPSAPSVEEPSSITDLIVQSSESTDPDGQPAPTPQEASVVAADDNNNTNGRGPATPNVDMSATNSLSLNRYSLSLKSIILARREGGGSRICTWPEPIQDWWLRNKGGGRNSAAEPNIFAYYDETVVCRCCYGVYTRLDKRRTEALQELDDPTASTSTYSSKQHQNHSRRHVSSGVMARSVSAGDIPSKNGSISNRVLPRGNSVTALVERLSKPRSQPSQQQRHHSLQPLSLVVAGGSRRSSDQSLASPLPSTYEAPVWQSLRTGAYGAQTSNKESAFIKNMAVKAAAYSMNGTQGSITNNVSERSSRDSIYDGEDVSPAPPLVSFSMPEPIRPKPGSSSSKSKYDSQHQRNRQHKDKEKVKIKAKPDPSRLLHPFQRELEQKREENLAKWSAESESHLAFQKELRNRRIQRALWRKQNSPGNKAAGNDAQTKRKAAALRQHNRELVESNGVHAKHNARQPAGDVDIGEDNADGAVEELESAVRWSRQTLNKMHVRLRHHLPTANDASSITKENNQLKMAFSRAENAINAFEREIKRLSIERKLGEHSATVVDMIAQFEDDFNSLLVKITEAASVCNEVHRRQEEVETRAMMTEAQSKKGKGRSRSVTDGTRGVMAIEADERNGAPSPPSNKFRPGFCQRCGILPATRRCLHCTPEIGVTDECKDVCSACYFRSHTTPGLRSHQFLRIVPSRGSDGTHDQHTPNSNNDMNGTTINAHGGVGAIGSPSTKKRCSECKDTVSARYCHDCKLEFCAACHYRRHTAFSRNAHHTYDLLGKAALDAQESLFRSINVPTIDHNSILNGGPMSGSSFSSPYLKSPAFEPLKSSYNDKEPYSSHTQPSFIHVDSSSRSYKHDHSNGLGFGSIESKSKRVGGDGNSDIDNVEERSESDDSDEMLWEPLGLGLNVNTVDLSDEDEIDDTIEQDSGVESSKHVVAVNNEKVEAYTLRSLHEASHQEHLQAIKDVKHKTQKALQSRLILRKERAGSGAASPARSTSDREQIIHLNFDEVVLDGQLSPAEMRMLVAKKRARAIADHEAQTALMTESVKIAEEAQQAKLMQRRSKGARSMLGYETPTSPTTSIN